MANQSAGRSVENIALALMVVENKIRLLRAHFPLGSLNSIAVALNGSRMAPSIKVDEVPSLKSPFQIFPFFCGGNAKRHYATTIF